MQIENAAVKLPIRGLVAYLQETLGPKVTAYVSGSRSLRAVQQWAAGQRQPRQQAEMRLRCAYQAARMVAGAYGNETARSWFLGMNTGLDDRAPAAVLRHAQDPTDLEMLLPAARSFCISD